MTGRDGILLVDKPVGLTSFGVVARVRRVLLGGRRGKCGHAGSLDPMATGLLVLMCGRATRLSPFLMGLDKRYLAVVRFGVETDTLDLDGKVTARRPVAFAPADLERALPAFTGELAQVPPAFSAIKRQGKRLYELARRGAELPELEAKQVAIRRLELTAARWGEPGAGPEGAPLAGLEFTAPDGLAYDAELVVECSSGTYMRSLARDLAAALGTVGHVRRLRRERVGPFELAGAVPQDRIEDEAALAAALRPLAEALPHLPAVTISVPEARLLARGGQPELQWLRRLDRPLEAPRGREALFRVLDPAGELVAVARIPAAGGLPRTAAVLAGA